MPRITIFVENEGADTRIVEDRSDGTPVAEVLGAAVNRTLRAVTSVNRYDVDGYTDAAWKVVGELDITASPA